LAAETRHDAPHAAERRAAEQRQQPEARPAVRPAAVDEMGGLEIPAFLRRQHS
jgi:hypothetical protein